MKASAYAAAWLTANAVFWMVSVMTDCYARMMVSVEAVLMTVLMVLRMAVEGAG